MKRYPAQALAVVMIVLVISVVLGLAMLSRTLRDTRQVANEKSSAEALELADSVLDSFKGTPLDTIENACGETYGDLKSANGCKVKGVEEVKAFLGTAGISDNAVDAFDKCTNQNSTLEITAKLAGPDDEYELRSDQVRSFVIRGQTPNPASCQLQLSFEPRGSSFGGVMISRVYARNYTNGVPAEYKDYAYDDLQQYCVHLTGKVCSDSSKYKDQWIPLESGTKISLSLGQASGYSLDEIRVRALGETVAMKASITNPDCIQKWEMVKLTVGANCSGTYRAKEIQVPQQKSALPLFDYVLFNGNGALGSD